MQLRHREVVPATPRVQASSPGRQRRRLRAFLGDRCEGVPQPREGQPGRLRVQQGAKGTHRPPGQTRRLSAQRWHLDAHLGGLFLRAGQDQSAQQALRAGSGGRDQGVLAAARRPPQQASLLVARRVLAPPSSGRICFTAGSAKAASFTSQSGRVRSGTRRASSPRRARRTCAISVPMKSPAVARKRSPAAAGA